MKVTIKEVEYSISEMSAGVALPLMNAFSGDDKLANANAMLDMVGASVSIDGELIGGDGARAMPFSIYKKLLVPVMEINKVGEDEESEGKPDQAAQ